MSLSQIILVGNWLLEGNLKSKITEFCKNKSALILSSLLLLHLIGLFYTSDFAYAFNDIRIKAPLLLLPLIISTSRPLSQKLFTVILQIFVGAIILGTIISTLILTDVIHRHIVDVRNISIFISHIRFALLICVAIFICGYFIYNTSNVSGKLVWGGIIIWFTVFLILMESITGLSVFIFTVFILITYAIITSKNKTVKWVSLFSMLLSLLFISYWVKEATTENLKKEIIDPGKLDKYTSQRNLYVYDTTAKQTENGYYVWMYYCIQELEPLWNHRSKINFNGKDLKGNEIRFTLMRYLTSKGLRKDADGLKSLTDNEINAIERGVVNVNFQNISSIKGRLHEIKWELDLYKTTGDPNGHSLTQRFEYWKTAFAIIKQNCLFGVGTGDVEQTFNKEYVKSNSPLLMEWRLRAHNQYLSIAVAFGIIGFMWFLITLIYPMIKQKMVFDYLYITFFIITVISFFTEDTLETQAGVTFYAFFNSFYLFGRKIKGKN